jgi:hypothetical protein
VDTRARGGVQRGPGEIPEEAEGAVMHGDDASWRLIIDFMLLGATIGLWKLGELVWWLVTHVKVSW